MANIHWKCTGKGSARHYPEDNRGITCKKNNCSRRAPLWYLAWLGLPWAAGIIGLSVSILVVTSLIRNRAQASSLLFVHIVDESDSARNNLAFSEGFHQTCQAMYKVARANKDRYAHIPVYSEIAEYQDATLVRSRQTIKDNCQLKAHPYSKQGTAVCPAWENTAKLISSMPNDMYPIVITQVHTNEYESFCPGTIENFYEQLLKHQGIHLIFGSTNDGNTTFNSSLFTHVNNSLDVKKDKHTIFLNNDEESCLKETAFYLRNKNSQAQGHIQASCLR